MSFCVLICSSREEKKECLEKKRVETLAAAELIRQPWAAMPRQVVVDVREQEGAAAKGCLSTAGTPRCRDFFRISCDSLSAAPIIATPASPARLLNTQFIQLHPAHQSIIPYHQLKAPEQTTTGKKNHSARLVFVSPPPPCGSRSPGAGCCSLGNQMQPELPRAIHLGAAPATGTLPAILAILDRRKTDGELMDGPCWASRTD